MKADWEDDYEMREEYDFSKSVRNPWIQNFRELNLVSLDEDLKRVFPDSPAVNAALRELLSRRKEQAANRTGPSDKSEAA